MTRNLPDSFKVIGFNNLNMAHVDTLWNIYWKNHDCFDLCCIFHANPPWTALGLLPHVAGIGFFNLISMGDPLSITRSTPPSPQMSEFEVQRKRAKSVYTRARWECSEYPKTTRKHSRSVILQFSFNAGLFSLTFDLSTPSLSNPPDNAFSTCIYKLYLYC